MVTGKQGRKLKDILGPEELKIPKGQRAKDKGSIIMLYEGCNLMNTFYCIRSTFTMKLYCYKAGLQRAEQACVCVETNIQSLKFLHVKNFHLCIKYYMPI